MFPFTVELQSFIALNVKIGTCILCINCVSTEYNLFIQIQSELLTEYIQVSNSDNYIFKWPLKSNIYVSHTTTLAYDPSFRLFTAQTEGSAAKRFLTSLSKSFHTQMTLNWYLCQPRSVWVSLTSKESCIRDEVSQRSRRNLWADFVKWKLLSDLTIIFLGVSYLSQKYLFFSQNWQSTPGELISIEVREKSKWWEGENSYHSKPFRNNV